MKRKLDPAEVLLVVDAMTGQDAVNAAGDFHKRAGLTGIVLSKLDGDARGGAALTATHVTGVPVKFAGVGEKLDALEPFHPERMASRILGMGDVLTLVERAQEHTDEQQVLEFERKLRKAQFDLEDFLGQLRQIQRMGPISSILGMLPQSVRSRMPVGNVDDSRVKRLEAIISSMTIAERRRPDILTGNRRRRVALGSGVTVQEVNQLLNQFRQMQKMMRQMASGKRGGFMGMGLPKL
jgi:signal recognition particle subunit SRP54